MYAHAPGGDRDETDIFALEHTADQGVYLDEHTVLKEMGAALGKIFAALAFAALAWYVSIPAAFAIVFILVGVLSGAVLLIERRSVIY